MKYPATMIIISIVTGFALVVARFLYDTSYNAPWPPVMEIRGKSFALDNTEITGIPFALNLTLRDPRFDFDFTNTPPHSGTIIRGNEHYIPPYGWQRIALNVTKYGPDDTWLGATNKAGEWPVSYHGTGKYEAMSIAKEGFKLSKGRAFVFGHGIYSTPSVDIAQGYASGKSYRAPDGKTYFVVIQSRVNPATIEKKLEGCYWLSPKDEDLRPYGILIKEV